MKLTDVDKYLALRESLTKEKVAPRNAPRRHQSCVGICRPCSYCGPSQTRPETRFRRKRAKNEMSMKEAAVKALAGKSLSRQDVLKAVLALGYQFSAKDPLNSISSLLYSDPSFKNSSGKFSLAK